MLLVLPPPQQGLLEPRLNHQIIGVPEETANRTLGVTVKATHSKLHDNEMLCMYNSEHFIW